MTRAVGLVVILLGSSCVAQDNPAIRSSLPLTLGQPVLSSPSIGIFEIEEATVPMTGTYDNPFDPTQISLDADITTPAGAHVWVPGFLYRSYSRSLTGGKEVLNPAGQPAWRVRYTPAAQGTYHMTLIGRDKSGEERSQPVTFEATPSGAHGFIQVSPKDPLHFQFSDGAPYFAIGINACWGGDAGTYSYDRWLPSLAQAGGNAARLWLNPDWSTFGLETAGAPSEGKGLGRFDLANAWRLDYVLTEGEQKGINFVLCLESYNVLRDADASNYWEKSPENSANGGLLRTPKEYWTNGEAERAFKNKLRYLVARYGAFANVLSWEFWNEVDLVRGYDAGVVQAWHQKMSAYLSDLDPYHHLRTTSFSSSAGEADIDRLPGLDYSTTHYYGPDPALATASAQIKKAMYGKPSVMEEVGADSRGPRFEDDRTGLQFHDAQWAALATGSAGGALPWWWDNYIDPHNLFGVLSPAAKFVQGIAWGSENFRPTTLDIAYAVRPTPPARKDLVFANGPVSWNATDANTPRFVKVLGGIASGDLPLPGILHGTVNHRDLHNPLIMTLTLDRPTRFEVEVGSVSGYGGAALDIQIDGKSALHNVFADPDGTQKTEDLTQYAGTYGVQIPAGRHTLRVENTGTDWFLASYRFKDLLERTKPPLNAWAVAGDDLVLAWLRVEGYTWERVVQKKAIPGSPTSIVRISGLAAGNWTAEIWDTWTGAIIETIAITVGNDGVASLRLPPVDKDAAVKLRKIN